MEIKRLTVYCASSAKIDSKYFDATEALAHCFLKENIGVVCGGGAIGLMGKLADVMLAQNGKVTGIMPKFMHDVEWAHPGIQDFQFTETMAERKAAFFVDVDGIVALPGSSGTWEELFEAITLKRLGMLNLPIVILNTAGYYDQLKAFMESSINENFMHEKHLDLWSFVDHPHEILPAIRSSAAWNEDAIKFATLR